MKKIFSFIIFLNVITATGQVNTAIDWPGFMAQHDLIWEEMPKQWNEGAFVGNGQVGMMVYANIDDNRLDFHIGRQDVTDHRKAPNKKTSMNVKGANLLDFSRLDIGRMVLRPVGKILDIKLRQDLWNAEIRGTIITDLGEITFRGFTPYDRMLNIVEVTSTETKNKKTVNYTWEWQPGLPLSPRIIAKPETLKEDYKFNPKPELKTVNGIHICEQSLIAGGDYATAWTNTTFKNNSSTMYIAVANEIPLRHVSAEVASKTVKDARAIDIKTIEATHRDWWHTYFQKSFISIPDGRMESFYWIQMYKMAASSRADGPALDLLGPFFKNTSWPGLWWNLNVQLTYWPFNASNHLDIAKNFITLIDANFDYMLPNKSGKSLGDFAWAMHNYWLIYSYEGNQDAIRDKWMPKAMKIAKVYETKMHRNQNGEIELTEMGSPEYNGFKAYPNTNYNLALVRWLLNTLVTTSETYGLNTEEVKRWKNELADLIAYPEDENGLMIASNQPVDVSHRHYSHLLGLYPLFQLNPNDPAVRDLVDKSVVHWHKIENSKGLVGYSYTGAASLYAALGRGNDANQMLQQFLDGDIQSAMLLPNTFYMEGHGRNPVIETPLSAASSTIELLLQSWGGKIRVFPATPDSFQDASFAQLRGEGGFLVSASRKAGKTEFVTIESLVGGPCVVKVPGWTTAVQISKGKAIKIDEIDHGEFRLDLKKGETITMSPEMLKKAVIQPVSHPKSEINLYGVKEGKSYTEIYEYPVPKFNLPEAD
ncbi:glycosyl hydrolase family 95 catalytic domain-containing protein [Formosa sp. 3Alg 14/1]|uniref:glycosyl hydrolase family 95 catalytic domain-containing protein n=1 Tax=Formosa sp. 3Alg 14/1 TaxID=3382190 RepID=UPI0039BE43A9